MRVLSNRKKLILAGGGGHCNSVLDTVKSLRCYGEIVITDSQKEADSFINGYRIVGNDEKLSELYHDGYEDLIISVGSIKDTSIRRGIFNRARSIGFAFPTIIDATAAIADDVTLLDGIFVGKSAVINAGSSIDGFAIINTGAIIEHNCHIGEFSHISIGAIICGDCEIGRDVFIGAGAILMQGITVEDNAVIGAGAVVLVDVPGDTTVTGVWKGTSRK